MDDWGQIRVVGEKEEIVRNQGRHRPSKCLGESDGVGSPGEPGNKPKRNSKITGWGVGRLRSSEFWGLGGQKDWSEMTKEGGQRAAG